MAEAGARSYACDVPFVAGAVVVVLGVLAFIALIPVSLVLRYRAGTSRRLARPWVANLNLVLLVFSTAMFLAAAGIATVWVADAFRYTLAGLAGGALLGVAGLWLSRWEATPHALYYTPNRWLILVLTLVVTSRVLYGFWRGWHAWQVTPGGESWLAAAGAAGSLAGGAVVLGYYLAYTAGLRVRVARHGRRRGMG